ncbi:MAG: DHH family phosphoesterase [Patescibacteria group bacterium]
MTFNAFREAADTLRASRNPLIILLRDVDADALGTSMAVARAVAQQGAHVTLYCGEPIPANLAFLLDAAFPISTTLSQSVLAATDAIVVADAGALERTGVAEEVRACVARGVPLINIDHHQVAAAFGTINLVDAGASAAAVLAYDLIKLGGWIIDRDMATAILAGIVADTGNFSNGGTTIRALEVAAHCYATGAESRLVIRALYNSKPVNALKLWGEILSRLTKHERLGIASTVILDDDFEKYAIDEESTEGLANFLNGLSDVKAALILKQLPNNEIRGSLRTTRDDVNVGKLAQALGGGGHRKAAGFTIPGRIVRFKNGWKVV